MSILLEALRKSEKNQHAREAPSIHTDDQSGQGSESLPTLPLALLLVAALFVVGWFVWHQYQPPAGVYQPPVSLPADKTRTVSTSAAQPEAGGQTQPQATAATRVVNEASRQQRTPVESFKPEPEKPKVSSVDRRATAAAEKNISQLAAKKTNPDRPLADVSKKPAHQDPAPISYWELPDAIRADVPEIKFSVLVYSRNPDDRFVLINGERLGEGDSPQSGLVVKEIRRDGVIFSYRLYQFLVER